MVQPHTLDKILEWRDEKDEPDAVEDILREVIVIPDDDDEETQNEMIDDRHSSPEVISSHEFVDTVHVQPLDYGALDERARVERSVSPEDDWAPSVKFIRRISTPPPKIQARHQERADRQQAHRTRIWQEAVSRRRDTAYTRHDSYRLGEGKLVSSEYTYSQPASSAYQAHGPQSRLTEHRPMYSNGNTEQPLIPKRHDGAFSQDRKVENGQRFRTAEADPLIGAYNYAQRPDYQAYAGHERLEPASNESYQRPRFTYPESESLIPSVEDGLHAFRRQEPPRQLGGPLQTQYQNRLVGPRIVELDDEPKTPILKRQRVEDVDWPSAKVAYQTVRHTQSPGPALAPFGSDFRTSFSKPSQYDQGPPRHVPTLGQVRGDANDGFKSAVIQHRGGNIVYETSTSQQFQKTDAHFQPRADPLPHHFRSMEALPAMSASRCIVSDSQLPPNTHRPMQYSNINSPAPRAVVPISGPETTQFVPRTDHGVQSMPIRLMPVKENFTRPGVSRPVMDQPCGSQESFRPSNYQPKSKVHHSAYHSHDHAHVREQHAPSFAASRPRDTFGQSSDPYTRDGQPSASRMAEYRTPGQDHEVVYITSSPPTGARYTSPPGRVTMTHHGADSHSDHNVDGRRGTHNHQTFHANHRNAHQLYHDPRLPRQVVLLD
ncbi:MAG: hypothetical protein Q9224_000384 [Gallowayella concinna]